MSNPDLLSAFKELSSTKQLERGELRDMLRDGVLAA